jgi:ectoine hydroxylase-related dioxygenase (phytanoyl-CoA dioxygenase family)
MTTHPNANTAADTLHELRESNDAINDQPELQHRLKEDGYLFFRSLLPFDELRTLRREMLTVMQDGGWISKGTDPLDGIAQPGVQCTEGDSAYTAVYHRVYALRSFHAIAHNPQITNLIDRIYGEPSVPQPQKVTRLWFPNYTEHTTPIHQDFVHFQGSVRNLTAWTPVGECPIELGGLAVLHQSHKLNRVVDHQFSLGAGSLAIDLEEQQISGEWHTTNYGWGDTLIFPAVTIHKALPNVTNDQMRVSLDNRYQKQSDQIAFHMTQPHLESMNSITWDKIYADWDPDDPLRYYWKNMPMPIIPRDETFSNRGFDDAVRLAEAGSERAILHLRRYIDRDPDAKQSRIANQVLETLDRAEK